MERGVPEAGPGAGRAAVAVALSKGGANKPDSSMLVRRLFLADWGTTDLPTAPFLAPNRVFPRGRECSGRASQSQSVTAVSSTWGRQTGNLRSWPPPRVLRKPG